MNNKQKSILAMLVSAFAFSMMGLFVKAVGDISVFQKSMIRSIVIMIISFFTLKRNNLTLKGIKHHKLLILRSFFGTVGIVLNYKAVDMLILSDSSVIFRLSTIFVIIFSWLFLKEKINLNQMITILIAFLGIIFVAKPAFSVRFLPYLIGISGSAMAAMAYVFLRILGSKIEPAVTVFYFATFNTIALIPFVIFDFDKMTALQFLYAVLAGVAATFGQMGISIAYKYAPAREVSIYNYSGVIFSAIFSIFLFKEIPDVLSVTGYIIVFVSSYYMYFQNNKQVSVKSAK